MHTVYVTITSQRVNKLSQHFQGTLRFTTPIVLSMHRFIAGNLVSLIAFVPQRL